MRCGKELTVNLFPILCGRNPRECAEAKGQPVLPDQRIRVATRTNALWQSYVQHDDGSVVLVATRANALWQRCAMVNRCRSGVVTTRANALW